MRRHIFKLIEHEINMAGVAVRKADDPSLQDELDQRYAQLPPEFLPTAQQIQDTISDTGIARTPQEFEQTEPLGDKNERAREGKTAGNYLNRLATEGALAEGLVRRKFPLLDEYGVDATKLPVLRDYTSRQSTLPEHDLTMQTEGQHFDEYGNILPGAIPPVNAVKRLSERDIRYIGSAGDFGLKPVKDAEVNFNWEKDQTNYRDTPIDLARRPVFPVQNAGFVSPVDARDVRRAEAANTDGKQGYVAIRGFGAPSDKAFSRTDISGEGREGIYTAPIPPERLVGIHRRGGLKEKDLTQNTFTSVFDDENIAQQINLPDNIPKRDFILNEMRLAEINNDSNQFAIEMDTLYENGELSKEERHAVFAAFEKGRRLQIKRSREELPEEWSQGSFGFNNPTLTPEEKEQYERQIMQIISQSEAGRNAGGSKMLDIQDYLRQGHSPVLNPRPVKKALPRHWSKDFDTTEDLRNVLRQARLMSFEDAKNIENIPLRPDVRDWELSHTAQGMKSIIPGIQGGKITDQGYVDEGGAFTYPPQLQSFLPMINPDARMSVTMPDIPGSMGKPSGRPSVLVGSFEKPEFHATQKEGRVQTEGFMPIGFDHSQAVLLTEPSRAFARQEVPMAIQNLVGGKMKDYAPGTFGYDEPVGRAMESFNILPYSSENPLSQFSGWGQPRTVDDVFRLSEPMDIAMRLLKDDGKQIRNNAPRYHTQFNDDNNDSASDYWLNTAPFLEALPDHLNPNHPNYIQPVAHRIKPNIQSIPQRDDEGWQDSIEASEPMEIAMRLLKERVSPEAKRHKLEYDKKYESSPERVKYREDLNRERRRRGIYGSHNHQDVSHTEGGKLTLEGEHENRARHFKDKGTLRHE